MIRVNDLKRTTTPGRCQITFWTQDVRELDKVIADNINKALQVDFRPQNDTSKKKRSLNANKYSWVLSDKLADALRISKDECHRMLLAEYGQTAKDEDGNSIIVSALATIPQEALIRQLGYIAPIATHGFVGDKEFIHYRVLKGSHEFTTREMSIFIDGIISECKQMGIETATPEEIERMKQMWKGE